MNDQYESRSIPITLTVADIFDASDLEIISSIISSDNTQLTSIEAAFACSIAGIRRANSIHLEGRTTGWNTWIAVLAIGIQLFLSCLATTWPIHKNNTTYGKLKRETFSLRSEQEYKATELRGLLSAPPSTPIIKAHQEMLETEQLAIRAAEAASSKAHSEELTQARASINSLENRIARLERRYQAETPEQMALLRANFSDDATMMAALLCLIQMLTYLRININSWILAKNSVMKDASPAHKDTYNGPSSTYTLETLKSHTFILMAVSNTDAFIKSLVEDRK